MSKPPSERILHAIWLKRLYTSLTFYSDVEQGCTLEAEVLHPGEYNTDGGPDFSQTKLAVGKVLLVGHAEVHHNASDWLRHKHQDDPAYDPTILHVVCRADCNIPHRTSGKNILTCVMHYAPEAIEKAERFLSPLAPQESSRRLQDIRSAERGDCCFDGAIAHPCKNVEEEKSGIDTRKVALQGGGGSDGSGHKGVESSEVLFPIPSRSSHQANQWPAAAESLFQARMLEKSRRFDLHLQQANGDMAETLYYFLLYYLGANVNNEPFAMVARSLPLRIVRKHTDSLEALECMYLGQAGFLQNAPLDAYQEQLQHRYHFLATKYALHPLSPGVMKLLRIRPAAFPYRRMAIVAALRYAYPLLESLLVDTGNIHELEQLLSLTPGDYWQHHYAFGMASQRPMKGLSAASIRALIINVVLPFRYFQAKKGSSAAHALEEIIALMRTLPAESNRITRGYLRQGYPIADALESQAILQLEKHQALFSFGVI